MGKIIIHTSFYNEINFNNDNYVQSLSLLNNENNNYIDIEKTFICSLFSNVNFKDLIKIIVNHI